MQFSPVVKRPRQSSLLEDLNTSNNSDHTKAGATSDLPLSLQRSSIPNTNSTTEAEPYATTIITPLLNISGMNPTTGLPTPTPCASRVTPTPASVTALPPKMSSLLLLPIVMAVPPINASMSLAPYNQPFKSAPPSPYPKSPLFKPISA